MMSDGKISNKQVKDIFTKALDENKNVLDIAKSEGTQISDKEEIRKIINEVFNDNPNIVNDYKNGKNVTGFIMGLIMKKTSGKVNPGITNMVLREELEKTIKYVYQQVCCIDFFFFLSIYFHTVLL